MKRFFSGVAIVGSMIGALVLFDAWTGDNSAPQQAALAAIAGALAVIPDCIARSIQLLTDDKDHVLRSIVSEIRREVPIGQPNIAAVSRESITHPEKRTVVRGQLDNHDIPAQSKRCPSCSEMNRGDAMAGQSCGKLFSGSLRNTVAFSAKR